MDRPPPPTRPEPKEELHLRLRHFAAERGWDRVANPAALVLNLVAETGEVAQLFRWLSPPEAAAVMTDPCLAREVKDELADVYWSLLRLADVLDINLAAALMDKLQLLEVRHPVVRPDPEHLR